MLTGERVARPQLVEDRNHHLADRVAAVAVGLGQRLLKRLERLLVVAAVPGLEGLVELVAVALETGAGRQAGAQKVELERLEQLDGLVEVAPREQDARERGGHRGVAGIRLERPP